MSKTIHVVTFDGDPMEGHTDRKRAYQVFRDINGSLLSDEELDLAIGRDDHYTEDGIRLSTMRVKDPHAQVNRKCAQALERLINGLSNSRVQGPQVLGILCDLEDSKILTLKEGAYVINYDLEVE